MNQLLKNQLVATQTQRRPARPEPQPLEPYLEVGPEEIPQDQPETITAFIGEDSFSKAKSICLDTGDGICYPMTVASVKSLINNLQNSLGELAASSVKES